MVIYLRMAAHWSPDGLVPLHNGPYALCRPVLAASGIFTAKPRIQTMNFFLIGWSMVKIITTSIFK